MYEQISSTNREVIAFWDRIYATTMMPWLVEGQSAWKENWERFIETVGFSCDMGVSNWSRMVREVMELYTKSYHEFNDYRQTVDNQWLHCMEGLRGVQQTQEEKARAFLDNITNLMNFAQRDMGERPEEKPTHH